jgi:hypothetical protein
LPPLELPPLEDGPLYHTEPFSCHH